MNVPVVHVLQSNMYVHVLIAVLIESGHGTVSEMLTKTASTSKDDRPIEMQYSTKKPSFVFN